MVQKQWFTGEQTGYVQRATHWTSKGDVKMMLFVTKIFFECVG